MLQLGNHITSSNDPLKKINNVDFFRLVSQPSTELRSQVNQLRTILTIDPKKYRQAKLMLPYVTCGVFSPPYRRLENFASIDCFIVDIDNLQEKEINVDSLSARLKEDQQVQLFFVSPGNNGLKVLFELKDKCFDRVKYSMFYKLFIQDFSSRYGLHQVIDRVTSDATRACFLSADEHAYFNPDALKVDMITYIDFDSYEDVNKASQAISEIEKAQPTNPTGDNSKDRDLSPDVLAEIKKKLNPNYREKKPKNYYVPPEVDDVLDSVLKRMKELGIDMKGSEPIHYGRKLRFQLGNRFAQINLFYGKKGFRLVKTPVAGSDAELNEVAFRILTDMFYH